MRKQIFAAVSVMFGGLALVGAAYATQSFTDLVDVQFTFNQTLAMAIDSDAVKIENLAPGASARSDSDVTITVTTNNSAGYTLSASVGDGTTYTSTALTGANGTFTSLATDAAVTLANLTDNYWGYTTVAKASNTADTKYSGLPYLGTVKTLNQTTNKAGAAYGTYAGGNTTPFAIGAKASSGKAAGTYANVVTFTAVPNVATHTIAVAKGYNVDNVILGTSGTSATYTEGSEVTISATCDSGYTFERWAASNDYGAILNANNASTTFTVGASDTTLTAYCNFASGS